MEVGFYVDHVRLVNMIYFLTGHSFDTSLEAPTATIFVCPPGPKILVDKMSKTVRMVSINRIFHPYSNVFIKIALKRTFRGHPELSDEWWRPPGHEFRTKKQRHCAKICGLAEIVLNASHISMNAVENKRSTGDRPNPYANPNCEAPESWATLAWLWDATYTVGSIEIETAKVQSFFEPTRLNIPPMSLLSPARNLDTNTLPGTL